MATERRRLRHHLARDAIFPLGQHDLPRVSPGIRNGTTSWPVSRASGVYFYCTRHVLRTLYLYCTKNVLRTGRTLALRTPSSGSAQCPWSERERERR